jgi:hypothetical protein
MNNRREILSNTWDNIRIKLIYINVKDQQIIKTIENIKSVFEQHIKIKQFHVGFTAFNCLYRKTTHINNHDIVFFVSHSKHNCHKNTLAYSMICQINEIDKRPISSIINVCLKEFEKNDLYLTLFHETFHALGFSKYIFDYNMIHQVVERSKLVPKLKTNGVISYTKTFFNCPSSTGAEIENDYSHLKKRLFFDDLMSPVLTPYVVITELDFKVLNDMPFYKVEFKNNTFNQGKWGKGLGCDFIKQSCLDYHLNHKYNSPFCFQNKERCIFNNNGEGRCGILKYNKKVPSKNRYFHNKYIGGHYYMDFCPYYEEINSCGIKGVCFDSSKFNSKCHNYNFNSNTASLIQIEGYWLNCTNKLICPENLQVKCLFCEKYRCTESLNNLCDICKTNQRNICLTMLKPICQDNLLLYSNSNKWKNNFLILLIIILML